MVKLKRLKIQKFRNVAPGTELRFRDSLNVLLGKNGTGKTTLLNLIVSLLRWDFSALLKEPVEIEYDLEAATGQVTVRLQNKPRYNVAQLTTDVVPASGELLEGRLISSGIDFETSGEVVASGGGLEVVHILELKGSMLTLRTPREEMGFTNLDRPILEGRIWVNLLSAIGAISEQRQEDLTQLTDVLLSQSVASRTTTLRRFDESLDYLSHITEDEKAFQALRYNSKGNSSYVVVARHGGPGAVQTEIQRQLDKSPEIDEIRVRTEDKSAQFLEKAVYLLGFEAAKVRIQRTSRETEPQERIEFGNIRFDLARRDRSIINHQLLSYGQKRLLSFYYYLACSPAVVVADELVNGMHHEWIEACMDELEGRQAFLTSQNPLLLDYLHFDSVDEVLSSFVLCRMEPHGEREQLHWENMTQEAAQGFFAAYQVGIQHVSDILHTRGLW